MDKHSANLNVKNLCSRKLWELLTEKEQPTLARHKQACHQELLFRRHYLPELHQLQGQNPRPLDLH
jgi:hypothetical protein